MEKILGTDNRRDATSNDGDPRATCKTKVHTQLKVADNIQSSSLAIKQTAEGVHDTFASIENAINVRHQIAAHPWISLGGAIAIAALLSSRRDYRPARLPRSDEEVDKTRRRDGNGNRYRALCRGGDHQASTHFDLELLHKYSKFHLDGSEDDCGCRLHRPGSRGCNSCRTTSAVAISNRTKRKDCSHRNTQRDTLILAPLRCETERLFRNTNEEKTIMKNTCGIAFFAILCLSGCNQGTPGGPGATGTSPTFGNANDTFHYELAFGSIEPPTGPTDSSLGLNRASEEFRGRCCD